MQKALIIIVLLISIIFPSVSAGQEAYTTWDDLVMAAVNGDEVAEKQLLSFKSDIENGEQWDKEVKDAYILVIQALSEYYSRKGMYPYQEAVLTDAMATFNKREPENANNPYTRSLWVYRTRLFSDIGDYDTMLSYAHEALKLFEEANDRSWSYAVICANIATAYLKKEDVFAAKMYSDEAYDLVKVFDNREDRLKDIYYSVVNIRGLVYASLKDIDEAEKCFRKIITGSIAGQKPIGYDIALNNLGEILIRRGDYGGAVELFKSAQLTTPDLRNTVLQNLAFAYYLTGDLDNAAKYLVDFNNESYRDAITVIQNYAETEREPYLKSHNRMMMYLNNLIGYKADSAKVEAFDANLYTRSISLAINQALRFRNDSRELTSLSSLRDNLLRKDLKQVERDSIMREIISLERTLLRSDSSILQSVVNLVGNWESVKTQIGDNEAVVLLSYLPIATSIDEMTPYYGAFVARRGDKFPRLIRLASVDEAEDLFYNNTPDEEFISNLYQKGNAGKLYKLLWSEIEPELSGVKTIYLSTCGPIATINFDALVDVKNKRLKDRYNIVLLSSPAKIAEYKERQTVYPSLAAFGAPSFNVSVKDMAFNADKYNHYSGDEISDGLALRGELLRGNWNELPGTLQEIESIVRLLEGKDIKSESYFGVDASEEAFKALSGDSPSIIHVATHGFVVSTQLQYDNSPFVQSMKGISENNSFMMWTGLVFSGGNNAWKGETIPAGVEDGILTAEEISRLDLSKTDLVVLSACETARGHIDPVEGVWGLQRAFKQAGVKTILMALWKVPDATTAMFMEEFYKQLLTGMTVRQAVKKAQDYLIANGADDPFYWAPFVVLD